MNSALLAIMIARKNNRNCNHNYSDNYNDNEKGLVEQINKLSQKLLLMNEGESMKILSGQTIKTLQYKRKSSIYGNHMWVLGSQPKELGKSFEDGLKEIVESYNPTEIQLIPSKIEDDSVCQYEIVMVVEKEKNTKEEGK